MTKGFFCCGPVDIIICRHLITQGKPAFSRQLNAISICFKSCPGFVNICHQRYLQLRRRYLRIVEGIPLTIDYNAYAMKGRWFNDCLIKRMKQGDPEIVIKNSLNGHTRKIIYEIALWHGYYWVCKGYKRVNKQFTRRGRSRHGLDTIDTNESYTKSEMVRLKVDYSEGWTEVAPGQYKWNRSEMKEIPGVVAGRVEGMILNKAF